MKFSYEAQQRFGLVVFILFGIYAVCFRWEDLPDNYSRYVLLFGLMWTLFDLACKAVNAVVAYVFRDRKL